MKRITGFSKISRLLLEYKIIEPEDIEIYTYGLEQAFIMFINIVTTIIIGCIFGMLWQCTIYTLFYIPLRSYAGGYHANNQTNCYFLSVMLIIAALNLISRTSWTYIMIIAFAMIATFLIFILGPIEDKNKVLEEKAYNAFKIRTRVILLAENMLLFLLLIINRKEEAACIVVSLIIVSGMLITGTYKNKIGG